MTCFPTLPSATCLPSLPALSSSVQGSYLPHSHPDTDLALETPSLVYFESAAGSRESCPLACVWQSLFQFCLILLSSRKVDPKGPCPLHQLAACFQLPCFCLLAGRQSPKSKVKQTRLPGGQPEAVLAKEISPILPRKGWGKTNSLLNCWQQDTLNTPLSLLKTNKNNYFFCVVGVVGPVMDTKILLLVVLI